MSYQSGFGRHQSNLVQSLGRQYRDVSLERIRDVVLITGNCERSSERLLKEGERAIDRVVQGMRNAREWRMRYSRSERTWFYEKSNENRNGRRFWREADCPPGWARRTERNGRDRRRVYFHISQPDRVRDRPPSTIHIERDRKRNGESWSENRTNPRDHRMRRSPLTFRGRKRHSSPVREIRVTRRRMDSNPSADFLDNYLDENGVISITSDEARRIGLGRDYLLSAAVIDAIQRRKISFPYKKFYVRDVSKRFEKLKKFILHKFPDGEPDKFFRDEYFRPFKILMQSEGFFPSTFKGAYKLHISSLEDYWEFDLVTDVFSEPIRLRARRNYQNMSVLEAFHENRGFQEKLVNAALRYRPSVSTEEAAASMASQNLRPDQEHARDIRNFVNGGINSFMLRECVYKCMAECTQFKVSLACGVLKFLNAQRVLDISAGWGDRLIGALACEVELYVAADPNLRLKAAHDKILSMFGNETTKASIIYKPFEEAELPEGQVFDTIFTSPPFFNFEIYVNDDEIKEDSSSSEVLCGTKKENNDDFIKNLLAAQSINRHKTLRTWLTGWLFPTLEKAWRHLAPGGHAAIHIADIPPEAIVCEPMCLFMQWRLPGAIYAGCLGSSGAVRKPRPIWVFRKIKVEEDDSKVRDRAKNAERLMKRYYQEVYFDVTGASKSLVEGNSMSEQKIPEYVSSTILKLAHFPSKYGEFFDLKADQVLSRAEASAGKETVADALQKLNPPVEIARVSSDRNSIIDGKKRTFKVIRDDVLPGGSKQRALGLILLASKSKKHMYAGPENGFAQVALAYASKICGKVGLTMVAEPRGGSRGKLHGAVRKAMVLGAKLIEVPPPRNRLQDIKTEARRVCTESENTDAEGNEKITLLPFGLDCEAFVGCLAYALRQSLPENLREKGPKRLWLVAGSSVLFATFHRMWPETHFLVVQVGKKIYPDQLEGKKVTKFIAPEKFWETARDLPPYPSVRTYDAKLWQFVLKYGEDGDYIWNVACDPSDERQKRQ